MQIFSVPTRQLPSTIFLKSPSYTTSPFICASLSNSQSNKLQTPKNMKPSLSPSLNESEKAEVVHDVFPYLRQYKDGSIDRLAGTDFVQPGLDPQTNVSSRDVVIDPTTGVSARIYHPIATVPDQKLPLVIYFHGGAFIIASTGEPKYHNFLNLLAAAAKAVVVSVNYRKAPEHPLPAAFDDAWAAVRWVASHGSETPAVDYGRVFLVGDSAGATMAHAIGCRVKDEDPGRGFKLKGIVHIHPYFWGKKPIGLEAMDARKALVDKWWEYVCPSDKGCDDPLINPFAEGAPRMEGLGCERVLVCVAEKDILRERGRLYYRRLVESKWEGKAEMYESKGEDHVFQIFDPVSSNALQLFTCLAEFIQRE